MFRTPHHFPAILLLSVGLMAGCGTSTSEGNGSTAAAGASAADPRDEWQQPTVLVEEMGKLIGGIQGKTIADLFAGDGYMTFKLIAAGANVIAIDTDPANVAAIEAKKKEMGLSDARLRTRTATGGQTGLNPGEVDMALSMHHYLRTPNRVDFFRAVHVGVKSPAPIVFIEFMNAPSPVGPPMEERIASDRLMDELDPVLFPDQTSLSPPGFRVPYQYVVVAQDMTLTDEELQQMQQGQAPQ